MKKILFLIAFVALGVTSKAQNGEWTYSNMAGYTAALAAKTLDTVSNTDTTYLLFTGAQAGYNVHIKATVTKISGTVGGSIILQGSEDNSTYFTLANVVSGMVTSQYADTATVTNATASYNWFYVGTTVNKFKYYRLRYISSGTQTSSFSGVTYYRKP